MLALKMIKLSVSAVIFAKNESANITECIESLDDFSEIYVIDSLSTDQTKQLALNLGVSVIDYEWNGQYPKKRQWSLEQVKYKNEWILFVDADERVTSNFVIELREFLANSKENYSAASIPIDYYFAGKRLKHGQRPRKIALLRIGKAKFPVINDLTAEGMGELEGHYQPIIAGRIKKFCTAIKHNDNDPISTWMSRHINYAKWEAHLLMNQETKIEVDRRRIRDRMAKLRKDIKEMKVARETKRQERDRNTIPSVAIAGYTNAGKSSLLNRLTGAGVLVENALFATLDPTTRRTQTGDGRVYTLTDTVGFVRHLPHQLVDAFKSTLEEVEGAALIVHVVDGSHPDPREQIRAVREVIDEIGAGAIPEIIAINKSDIADPDLIVELVRSIPGSIAISAQSGFGIERLVAAIEAALPHPKIEITVTVPYSRGDLVYAIHESGEIFSEEYVEEGTLIHALVNEKLAAKINDVVLLK
jgi:glycosyltransferase involved in cell wall biosynthesis